MGKIHEMYIGCSTRGVEAEPIVKQECGRGLTGAVESARFETG